MQWKILVITLNANKRAALFFSVAERRIFFLSVGVLGRHVLLISFCRQRNKVAVGGIF